MEWQAGMLLGLGIPHQLGHLEVLSSPLYGRMAPLLQLLLSLEHLLPRDWSVEPKAAELVGVFPGTFPLSLPVAVVSKGGDEVPTRVRHDDARLCVVVHRLLLVVALFGVSTGLLAAEAVVVRAAHVLLPELFLGHLVRHLLLVRPEDLRLRHEDLVDLLRRQADLWRPTAAALAVAAVRRFLSLLEDRQGHAVSGVLVHPPEIGVAHQARHHHLLVAGHERRVRSQKPLPQSGVDPAGCAHRGLSGLCVLAIGRQTRQDALDFHCLVSGSGCGASGRRAALLRLNGSCRTLAIQDLLRLI
eukprot:scaffold556_cov221-Pinguiococcus_pyrenoidosus.AAC.1